MACQEFSKIYSSILMVQLLQLLYYFQHQEFFLLFLFWTWIIQNLLCYYLHHLCDTAINFLIFCITIATLDWITHWYHYINIFFIIYLYIVYFTYADSEWCKIFKCYLFISFACLYCRWICFCFSNFYNPLHNYERITAVTEIDLTICILSSVCIIINIDLFFVLNLDGLLVVLPRRFNIFWQYIF